MSRVNFGQEFAEYSRRRRVRPIERIVMQFAVDNIDKYETPEELIAATKEHLQSGEKLPGSITLTFIITQVISTIISQIVIYLWDRWRREK